jgi:hypothetical protein
MHEEDADMARKLPQVHRTHMIDVARAEHLLIISDRPGRFYKLATFVWPVLAVVLLTTGDAGNASVQHALSPELLRSAWYGAALVITLLLLWGWTTTAHRFDRAAGTLVIARSGLVRPKVQRDLALTAVAAVVDRRSDKTRAIELLLADTSTLVVARTESSSRALDSVARELGDLLQKPVRLARGVVIDRRFEIERFVDQGGMGIVYRALDRETGSPVALKLAQLSGDTGPQRQRFQREMGLLAAFDHPRVVRHVRHGQTGDGTAYLAMQWLDGEDLRVTLTRGPLSLDDSLALLRGAAEAIAEVHAHGVIHRDLKPGNLFLQGRAAMALTLLDFGIARRIDSATHLTGSRSLIGTPHYMAPEQASSASDIGAAADVFSLGCIFYECLTGKSPFDAKQLLGVLARILFDRPEPVQTLRPAVPEAWASLLARMLAKDPRERPADGAALVRELSLLPSTSSSSALPRESAQPDELAATGVLDAEPADDGDRVLVTAVLVTLPRTGARDGDEAARFVRIRGAIERFGCPIERLADGSLLATVEARPSATDQVRIAARCALYLRELLPDARISVATGRAPRRRSLRVGDAVDRAVLLQESALDTDAVRLDAVTASLLEGHFVITTRDSMSLLLAPIPELDESRPLLGKPTPCVGRELELVQLEGLMVSAVEEGAPRAALVLGAPGIGKSRLRHELSRRLADRYPHAVQLVGYGDPLHAGSPYVLLGAALRRHAGIRGGESESEAQSAIVEKLCRHLEPSQHKRVSEFLGELCGVPFCADGSPPLQAARGDHRVMSEQISAAFVDWLAAECTAQPVLFVLEDVHWADALSFKLLEVALQNPSPAAAALCVLAFGRPESESSVPKLFSGQLSISLGSLSDKASEALVREVLGPSLEGEHVRRIVRLAAGNALFLEELIRAAKEGKAGDVPDTVLAMVQARLSRLTLEERLFLRSASVFGERFWQGGLAHLGARWNTAHDAEHWLGRLVDGEFIVRERASRIAGDVEYTFRHALVCDAAYGLLTAVDKRAAHAAAGHWLEQRGETDSVVLARHAEESGDRERAMSFYTRAAERSLEQYDFGEALLRAQRGAACGAFGQSLGTLECIQCAAFYSMGRWMDAAALGLRALTLLTPGSSWWCVTVEKLMQVLPNVGRLEQSRELSDELLAVEPEPGARAAYASALHAQLLGYAVSGAHARGRKTLDFIDRLGPDVLESDVAARGNARLWRAVYTFILTTDTELALSLVARAIEDLTESQVLYRLSFAHILEAFIWWGLGDFAQSERAARTGRAIARRINDGYHDALASWYLSLALSEQPETSKLDEAEQCAWELKRCADNPIFDATSRNAAARIALARGDFVAAETLGTEAREGLRAITPYSLLASSSVLSALAAQGRWSEAAELARHDLDQLDALEGPVFCELMFRVAAIEALRGAGQTTEADVVLTDTHQLLQLRANKIVDPVCKARYLTARLENRQILSMIALSTRTQGMSDRD